MRKINSIDDYIKTDLDEDEKTFLQYHRQHGSIDISDQKRFGTQYNIYPIKDHIKFIQQYNEAVEQRSFKSNQSNNRNKVYNKNYHKTFNNIYNGYDNYNDYNNIDRDYWYD